MADTEQIAPSITGTHEWAAVAQHHAAVAPRHLRELFTDDPGRVEALTGEGARAYLNTRDATLREAAAAALR